MYKAVILDLDGTLLDTLTDLADSVNFGLSEMGYPLRTKDEVRRFIGNGVVKLVSRAVPQGTSEQDSAKCLAIFRAHYLENMRNTTKPYEGIMQMLDELKLKGIKTAVVSNKLHEAVVELCDDFFEGKIDVALGVSNEDERKPKPTNVFKAMQILGVNESEALYVGDSEVDVQTAKNAGLKCIGVTWGFRDKAELLAAGADFIANEARKICSIVLDSGKIM
ncbi:MAG: HAD-IIIA family hydrolase [Clostridia bacterium]